MAGGDGYDPRANGGSAPVRERDRMPRLVFIEGPRSGDYFKLAGENYLGLRSGTLSLAHAQDGTAAWAYIRAQGERYELQNLGPRERIQVNGEGVQKAF